MPKALKIFEVSKGGGGLAEPGGLRREAGSTCMMTPCIFAFFFFGREQYNEVKIKRKARFYGGYQFSQRFLVITDPDLAKDIMVKNFHCFVDRQARNAESFILNNGTLADEINARQFVVMKGDPWKEARSAFSPIFTSGKMKTMFPLLKGTSDKLMESLEADVKEDRTIELKSLLGKFSMDTIASCAFGVDAKSFDVAESDFVHHAKNVFRFKPKDILKVIFLVLVPGMGLIFKWLRLCYFF